MTPESRPDLSIGLEPGDLQKWYWTRAELADIARGLGIPTSGRKAELAARIEAALAGEPSPVEPKRKRVHLEGELNRQTVIPEGIVLSRHLREWFEAELGPGFRADGHMRRFLAEGEGRTLGEAADHWLATREMPAGEIGPQFELNRFTRSWWQANPDGTPDELRQAWVEYRSSPAGERSMPGEDLG